MDFFRAQDDARRRTRWLAVLFAISLASLLALSNGLLFLLFRYSEESGSGYAATDPLPYLLISALIILIVLFSSLFKSLSLRKGGSAVAEMLDARLLVSATSPQEQRLLNVVEEMAIASGMPVPPVYVMEEPAINAFAAGHSTANAVIGVTRGAMEKLGRDELQGVIAHEFSHILHGDMRLNLRLIGWLHGIMVLGVMGQYLVRAASASRRNNNNAAIAILGLGLIIIGASGSFFGSLIKAAVSRQREYLADASAVQYTRNPDGIASALKRIASDTTTPWLSNPAASQISHALFAEGVRVQINRLFATHPPIEKRIQALLPHETSGHGSGFIQKEFSQNGFNQNGFNQKSSDGKIRQDFSAVQAVSMALARSGSPDESDIRYARQLQSTLPEDCLIAARDPHGALVLVVTILASVSERVAQLPETAPELQTSITRLVPTVTRLSSEQQLSLVNICLPALRQLSQSQYAKARTLFGRIAATGEAKTLTGWLLHELVCSHLDRFFGLRKEAEPVFGLARLNRELSVFFSTLASLGHARAIDADLSFQSVKRCAGLEDLRWIDPVQVTPNTFQEACTALISLKPSAQKQLMAGITACIYFDEKLNVNEHMIMRTVSEMLGCPLPANIDWQHD